MDDIARFPSLKRKADTEECTKDPSPPEQDDILLEDSNAPRQQAWLHQSWHEEDHQALQGRRPKRPRIEIPDTHRQPPRRSPRSHPSSSSTVPTRRSRKCQSRSPLIPPNPLPSVPIDPNSPHIPSLQPLVNRQTLKELDLEAILRNPQLRHDLLFDSGLQFRPTAGRRKRELSENYWNAIQRELEMGCTCVSFDLQGKPHALVCACLQVPLPTTNPVLAFSSSLSVLTLRMPSRIQPLLTEFLEVLLSVIQPLSRMSGMYVHPGTFESQMRQHAAQAAHLRSVFDPDLIQQEIQHNVFDPSGLFRAIGDTLKSHCAPMRDGLVETMVEAAQSCSPGGPGGKSEAVKALRMCLEILELMKLDIANHQLQTLRPFLIRTSGQFELKAFRGRKAPRSSLHATRAWLSAAHTELSRAPTPIPHPSVPAGLTYSSLQRNQRVYLAVLRGFTDLVFFPPVPSLPSIPSSSSPPPTPLTPASPEASCSAYPETTYLDTARLALLARDTSDTAATYMFLMLFRQLCASSTVPDATQLAQLRREIRDIGSTYLGLCLTPTTPALEQDSRVNETQKRADDEQERSQTAKQDVVLQVAMRATLHSRRRRAVPSSSTSELTQPDARIQQLASQWAATHMHPGAPLATLLRTRLRDAVFAVVLSRAFPSRDMSARPTGLDFAPVPPPPPSTLAFSAIPSSFPPGPIPTLCLPPPPPPPMVEPEGSMPALSNGMEPLADDIRALGERIARLALIHLNAYLPVYEEEGMLES